MSTPYQPQGPSAILQDLLNLGVLRVDKTNARILLPDGTDLQITVPGALKLLGKVIVNNNAAASYNVPANTGYVAFTGTQQASLTINFPAAAAAIDGEIIAVFSQAAVGTALTLASIGATFVGAPATLTAGQVIRFIYNHATTQWLPI